jgi:hypothetical protein
MMEGTVPHVRRILTAACGSVAALSCVLPGAASAQLDPPASCSTSTLSQPFLPWSDARSYELVPGGDFEGSLDGWSLTGNAGVAAGSETFAVTGTPGSSSLALPDGAVATAPPVCVNVAHLDARLFVRTDSPGATLRVRAVYDNGQTTVTIPSGPPVSPTSAWEPTRTLGIHPVVIPALHGGGSALITLSFAATGGTVYIDDVFVDPWRSG